MHSTFFRESGASHSMLTFVCREGAGDCSSCVAVMLELARGISQWAHGFKHAVIFLFNTGEEEGLNGAHSFITQVLTKRCLLVGVWPLIILMYFLVNIGW